MNMKEEFKELYDMIIGSNDEEKMHVLGQVTKSMMCKFIDNYPQQAREYLDMLQSVKWHNYVTAKEAEQIVANMKPSPAWTRTAWDGMMTNLGYPKEEEPYYNEHALYVTMCMKSSDSGDTIISEMNANGVNPDRDAVFKFIYKLAIDVLKDKDHMFNIRSYFKL